MLRVFRWTKTFITDLFHLIIVKDQHPISIWLFVWLFFICSPTVWFMLLWIVSWLIWLVGWIILILQLINLDLHLDLLLILLLWIAVAPTSFDSPTNLIILVLCICVYSRYFRCCVCYLSLYLFVSISAAHWYPFGHCCSLICYSCPWLLLLIAARWSTALVAISF